LTAGVTTSAQVCSTLFEHTANTIASSSCKCDGHVAVRIKCPPWQPSSSRGPTGPALPIVHRHLARQDSHHQSFFPSCARLAVECPKFPAIAVLMSSPCCAFLRCSTLPAHDCRIFPHAAIRMAKPVPHTDEKVSRESRHIETRRGMHVECTRTTAPHRQRGVGVDCAMKNI
jgi:hypothetical protein